jgi:hypothetical protein
MTSKVDTYEKAKPNPITMPYPKPWDNGGVVLMMAVSKFEFSASCISFRTQGQHKSQNVLNTHDV